MKITDKYGNKVGSVDQHGNNFTVKNNYGNKVGSGEKEFLGNDYNIRNEYGDRIGKAEKDLFGNGYTVKDTDGNKVGRVTSKSSSSGFGLDGAGVIALIVIAVLLFFGIKHAPEMLEDIFTSSDNEKWLFIGPAIIFVFVNFVIVFLKKDSINTEHPIKNGLLRSLAATAINIVIVLVWGWIDKADDSSMLDRIFEPILIAIIVIPTLLIIFLPIGLVFGIIHAIRNSIKKSSDKTSGDY